MSLGQDSQAASSSGLMWSRRFVVDTDNTWEYNIVRPAFLEHRDDYVIAIRQEAAERWTSSVRTRHRCAVRTSFRSLSDALVWCEEQVALDNQAALET
jgi:hypothetical protein